MRNKSVKALTQCALFAALIAICAWLALPGPGGISFTMQTFGAALALGLLGGKKGTAAICVYLLLGVVGAPVFSGFRSGIGALLDASGGYLLGLAVFALVYWAVSGSERKQSMLMAMIAGMLGCYLCGALWYLWVYLPDGSGVWAAVSVSVLPYILPDALKVALAFYLSKKLKRFVY